MNYLYEVKVVDKDLDETEIDVVATDIEAAIFKANHYAEEQLDIEFRPYRIKSIKEDRTIDTL